MIEMLRIRPLFPILVALRLVTAHGYFRTEMFTSCPVILKADLRGRCQHPRDVCLFCPGQE